MQYTKFFSKIISTRDEVERFLFLNRIIKQMSTEWIMFLNMQIDGSFYLNFFGYKAFLLDGFREIIEKSSIGTV